MTRPQPSPADIAAAERLVVEIYDNDPEVSRRWIPTHRPALVRQFATAEMQKRQDREFRAALARSKRADKRSLNIIDKDLPTIRGELLTQDERVGV